MISYLQGEVTEIGLTTATVLVGGVGMEVHCTPQTLSGFTLGKVVNMPAILVVREESLTLFGFASAAEKQLFGLLQKVSGVGPRLALAVLSVHAPEVLHQALGQGDVAKLTKVPGIGPKVASRMILELKDKVASVASSSPTAVPLAWQTQVEDGLVGLGWSVKDADKAIAAVAAEVSDTSDVGALLRAALQKLRK